MRIEGIVGLENVVDKLAVKHHVKPDEVEELLNSRPRFFFVESGDREGEDVYGIGSGECRPVFDSSLHLQAHRRGIDLERPRYGG
jgi:hypothetical protein